MGRMTVAYPKVTGHQPTHLDFNQLLGAIQKNDTGTQYTIYTEDVDIKDIAANTVVLPDSTYSAIVSKAGPLYERTVGPVDKLLIFYDVDYSSYVAATAQTNFLHLDDCIDTYLTTTTSKYIFNAIGQQKAGKTITIYGVISSALQTSLGFQFDSAAVASSAFALDAVKTVNIRIATNGAVTSFNNSTQSGTITTIDNTVPWYFSAALTLTTAATSAGYTITIKINGVTILNAATPTTFTDYKYIYPGIYINGTTGMVKNLFCKVS